MDNLPFYGTFLRSDSVEAQAAKTLSRCREQLKAISKVFDYQMSPRDISLKNLTTSEQIVREILAELDDSPYICSLLRSSEEVRANLHQVIDNLCTAADTYEWPKTNRNRSKTLYSCYREVYRCIYLALDTLPKE